MHRLSERLQVLFVFESLLFKLLNIPQKIAEIADDPTGLGPYGLQNVVIVLCRAIKECSGARYRCMKMLNRVLSKSEVADRLDDIELLIPTIITALKATLCLTGQSPCALTPTLSCGCCLTPSTCFMTPDRRRLPLLLEGHQERSSGATRALSCRHHPHVCEENRGCSSATHLGE